MGIRCNNRESNGKEIVNSIETGTAYGYKRDWPRTVSPGVDLPTRLLAQSAAGAHHPKRAFPALSLLQRSI